MYVTTKKYKEKSDRNVMTDISSCFRQRHRIDTLLRIRKQPVVDEKQRVLVYFF